MKSLPLILIFQVASQRSYVFFFTGAYKIFFKNFQRTSRWLLSNHVYFSSNIWAKKETRRTQSEGLDPPLVSVSICAYYYFIWGKWKDLQRRGKIHQVICLGGTTIIIISEFGNPVEICHVNDISILMMKKNRFVHILFFNGEKTCFLIGSSH